MGVVATTTTEPRIYVACLAAYNNGHLHGAWIDAAQEPWSIWEDVQAMLKASPIADAEEWAIHDYEGFGRTRIEEYASFERVSALAAFLAEHGEIGAALLDYYCGDLNEAQEAIDERYIGQHSSLADYVQELTEEVTAIPTTLRNYIDWEAMARDAELNGDVFTIETGFAQVHVFAGH